MGVLVSGNIEALATDQSSRTDGRDLGSLGSGNIMGLPEGSSITHVAQRPAGGYVEHVKHELHLIAAGMGITYEMLTGDVREVNYSSARTALQEFRRNAESEQWNLLIPRLIEPVYVAFVAALHDATNTANNPACDHSTPKWEYIDPEGDTKSEQLAIATGLMSPSESLRRRGYKPDEVFAEIKKDLDRLRADGTLDVLMLLQAKQAPQPAPTPTPAPTSARSAELDTLHATLAALTQTVRQDQHAADLRTQNTLQAIHAATASRQTAAPAPIHIHPAPVTVHAQIPVYVPAAEIRAEVHVPSPSPTPVQVHVEAPTVRVEPNITVQPAQVNMPARKVVTQVHRNTSGAITGSTQTETPI